MLDNFFETDPLLRKTALQAKKALLRETNLTTILIPRNTLSYWNNYSGNFDQYTCLDCSPGVPPRGGAVGHVGGVEKEGRGRRDGGGGGRGGG